MAHALRSLLSDAGLPDHVPVSLACAKPEFCAIFASTSTGRDGSRMADELRTPRIGLRARIQRQIIEHEDRMIAELERP
jgi:hypothetical protein